MARTMRLFGQGARLSVWRSHVSGTSGEYESMKSRETLIRLKKFQVDEKRRKVAQIEGMIAEFERMGADLEREIKSEQDRAGIHDPGPFRLSDLCQGRDERGARTSSARPTSCASSSTTPRRRSARRSRK